MEDSKLIDWLKTDFEAFKRDIKADLKLINEDISSISKFRWQIMGGTAVLSFIMALLIQIFMARFSA